MTDSGIRCACFTGHRQIPHAQGRPVVQALRQEIIHAAGTGITRFYAGGALGFDTLAALTVLEMRKTLPSSRRIAQYTICCRKVSERRVDSA